MQVYLLWELKKHKGPGMAAAGFSTTLISVCDSSDLCWAYIVDNMRYDFDSREYGIRDVDIEPSPVLLTFKPNEIPKQDMQFFTELMKNNPVIRITQHHDRLVDDVKEYWYWIEIREVETKD